MTNYTFQSLFDFTRTTSGTFVGSNGLIQTTPASVNLLTFTQDFDNAAWTKSNSTVTANATTAPDGTATADALIETTATGTHVTYQVFTFVAATAYTYSAYVKANGRTKFDFASLSGFSPGASFDLTAVTATPLGATSAATITAVGNGWYRCTATRTSAGGSDQAQIRLVDAAGASTYTGNGTSGIYVWGAQLEAASAATTYTRNNGGRFPARFDYDPVTLAPKGILIEEQRTNLLLRSEEFDNAAWTKNNATVTANSIISPSGALNADTLTRGSFASEAMARQTTSQAVSTTHTLSVFAKAGSAGALLYLRNVADNVVGTPLVTFALDGSNTMTPNVNFVGSSTITPFGNGWYRCTITSTTAAVISGNLIDIGCSTNAGNLTGTAGAFIYVYGAQLEAGAFATSYIPTAASQVTRAADQTSIVAPNFAPWYNQSEGTFVTAFDMAGGSASFANNRAVLVARESATSGHNIYNGSGQVTGWTVLSGVDQAYLTTGAVAADTVTNIAYAYKANDFAASRNGGTVATDTSGTLPTPTVLGIGSNSANALFLSGHIRSVQYYPFRASDTQLQALST